MEVRFIFQFKAWDIYVDSCSELATLESASIDLLVSNYVLMDAPNLMGTMQAFNRVLRKGGVAIVVFSHPCFPQSAATVSRDNTSVQYRWDRSYFAPEKRVDPPWAHFKSDFTWFHRPLSDYWKAFKSAGFDVLNFEEPRLSADRYHMVQDERKLANYKSRPYSVAFKLRLNGAE